MIIGTAYQAVPCLFIHKGGRKDEKKMFVLDIGAYVCIIGL